MATYEELMAGLRKAHASGDTEGAKLIAAQARAARAEKNKPLTVDVPVDLPSPQMPAEPVQSRFVEQLAGLMVPLPPTAEMFPRTPDDTWQPDIPFDPRALPRSSAMGVIPTGASAAPPSAPVPSDLDAPPAMPAQPAAPTDSLGQIMRSMLPPTVVQPPMPAPTSGQGNDLLAIQAQKRDAEMRYMSAPIEARLGIENEIRKLSQQERAMSLAGQLPGMKAANDQAIAEVAAQNYTPLGEAISTELGNTPERVERGLRGNALAWAEQNIIANFDVIGRTKQAATRLQEIEAKKAEIQAGLGAPSQFGIANQLAELDALDKEAAMLSRIVNEAGLDDQIIDRSRGQIERSQRLRNSQQADIDELQKAIVPTKAAPGLNEALVSGIASMGDMAPGLAASIVTQNPLPMMAYLGAYSRGSTYADKRADGAPSDKALTAANLYALAEAIPEALPLHVILKGGVGAVSKVAGGGVTEAASEALTQALQIMIDKGVLDEDTSWAEAKEQMAKAAAAGGVMGVMMGGVGAGADVIRNSAERRRQAKGTPADPNASPPPRDVTSAPPPPSDPMADLVKAMTPQAAPAAAPEQTDQTPQSPAKPDPMAQITAAMTGQPAPTAAPQSGQNSQSITRAEAEANPDRYEIIDEAEGQGANWRPTGAQVVVDKQTGQAIPLAPDAAAAPPPAADGAPGGVDSAGIPQAAPEQGNGDVPAVAGPAPEADVVAAAGGTTPPATVPNQPRSFEFVDAAGVQNIETEPDVMQYKAGGDSDGVTDRLRGVAEWIPARAGISIIYEYADGRRVIADGHQRLGLAKRLAAQGKPIQMPAMVLRQVDGVTPEDARVQAALKNIAEGSGTALDAAKVLRGSKQTPEQLALPPNSAMVRDAMGMKNLSDQAFGMVVNGVSSERDGGIVGRVVTNKDAQANILGLLARMQKDRPITAFQAEQVAKQAAADTVTETQDSLFGPETDTKNLYLERAKILEAASKMKREEQAAFKNVIANADRLAAAGNQLDAEGNQTRLDSAAAMRDYLNREANTKGAISEALTTAARALNGGATIASATRQFLDAIEKHLASSRLEQGQRPGSGGGVSGGDQGGATPQPDSQPEPEPQAVEADRDGEPEVDMFGVPVRAPIEPDSTLPDDDMFGATPQTGKTPDQVRAEAEAETRKNQGKIRKTDGNGGDAGPLFGAQPDLLASGKQEGEKSLVSADAEKPASDIVPAPKRMTREEFAAETKRRLDALPPAADHLQKGDTNLVGTKQYEILIQRLSVVDTLAERSKVADEWVLEFGTATNSEHMVGLDKDGFPLNVTRGKGRRDTASNKGYSVSLIARVYLERGTLAYATHNHPRSTTLSPSDAAQIALGITKIVAVGNTGSRSEAVAGPKMPIISIRGEGARFNKLAGAMSGVFNILAKDTKLQQLALSGQISHDTWDRSLRAISNLAFDRMGLIDYKGDAAQILADAGINFGDIYDRLGNQLSAQLRRAGFSVTDRGDRIRDTARDGDASGNTGPAGSQGGTSANTAGSAGNSERNPQGAAGGLGPVKPPSTGNADLDGALDDIFGDKSDVPSTSNDMAGGGRDGASSDGMGAGNVPAAPRPSGRGTGRRGGKTADGDGKRSASSGLPDGDAPSVGSGSNPGADGSGGTNSQPAASGNGGSGNGGRGGRLSSDTGGKANTSGNASGSTGKLTPAQRLAAIRNVLKEDAIDFVAGPDWRDNEARTFAKNLKDELGLRELSVFVSGAGDLRLNMIAVPRDQQGSGIGTEAMQRLVEFADDRGLRITLSVGQPDDGFGTTSRSRLVRFYKRFGFVENAGRNKDFSLSPGMYRNARRGDFAEDPATGIDPRKAEALESIFVGALDGVDIAKATDRELFRSVVMPLAEAGMTRAEVAELTPYLEAFLADLRAGRVNLDPEPMPTPAPIEADKRAELQAAADKIKVKPTDRDNIDATLPLLLPVQRDDVFKIETRFAKPEGHGFLLTNGTGTGKTYSGAGVAKRFYQAGKTNILIIGPDATLPGWGRTLDALGIPSRKLKDTTDAGEGVVYTTHENTGMNNALATRDWDLVIVDESQKLSSNAAGNPTDILNSVRAITHRPEDLWRKSKMLHADDWARYEAMPDGEPRSQEYRRLKAREEKEVAAWAQRPRPKLLMLSATPFAYDKSIDYAEGYLFDYPKDGRIGNSNQGGRELFMVSNFGYRIRYHKLTKPEHAVDSAVFEREFHERLKREGVLSGRSLQVDVDYDRRFVTVADAIGTEIDAILKTISEGARSTDKALSDGYETISKHMRARFGYLPRMQLLEAIKAKAAVEDIKKHLAMGRKVVVFHDFNKGGGFNPFAGMRILDDANALAAMADLTMKHPDWEKLNFSAYPAPNVGLKNAFGNRAGVFSGITKKDRDAQLNAFNTDGSGVDVLIVQSDAGGAGVSMHDITGAHQRVLINLGMPVKPTTTLQSEGRILRVGTKTDAAFRYYTIGTSWERTAFAQRIAERSGTVENLALGNEARAITSAFIDAYMDAETFDPSDADGKGGKEKDRAGQVTTPWQKAIAYYFGRMKTTGRRDQRQGLDFYPTPEPLGLKMVEWAGIRPNERVLEPSAGDGAVARFMPDSAAITLVEPSDDLGSTALLRQPRANLVSTTFENHHISNKYHAIVMNPPFGTGGKTAYEHLEKAMKHLRPGGRIVALVPTGPAADKRWEAIGTNGFSVSTIVLPAVTFERAGTSVMSRIIIMDKWPLGLDGKPDMSAGRDMDSRSGYSDLSNASTIQQLFDRLENMRVSERIAPVQDVIEELEAEGQDAETPPNRKPGPPLATDIGAFEKTTVTSKKGKVFPAAHHAAKVERGVYDQMKAAATALDGWWHKNDAAPKGSGPTFAFRSEADRDAFLADMQKPTAAPSFEETAYHGTPHDFERFSLDAIGTGEGAQAYGWGLYFADRRDLAEHYRKTLTQRQSSVIVDGKRIDRGPEKLEKMTPEQWAVVVANNALSDGLTIKDAIRKAQQSVERAKSGDITRFQLEAGWGDVGRLQKVVDILTEWSKAGNVERFQGRLFTVEIPDVDNLLDWDADVRKQPETLRNALNSLLPGFATPTGDASSASDWIESAETPQKRRAFTDQFGWQIVDFGNFFAVLPPSKAFGGGNSIAEKRTLAEAKKTAESVRKNYDSYDINGRLFYNILSERLGGDRAASEALRAAGIPGHRYLDGFSRNAGEGSYNYVIYDDQAIQIIEKEQRAQMVREAAATTEEITRLMPKLRAELDRLDLKRVKLTQAEGAEGYQGAFIVTGDGEMEIIIGASLDPVKTLHHEVIHALRAMNLFTPAEWTALTLAAERKWLAKHDIAARYPHLTEAERIEEAVAEEFSEAIAKREAPKGSILITAFNKIARLFRALRNVLNGAGYQTPEAIFGRVLAGEISARQAGNTGAQVSFQRKGRDTATGDLFAQPEPARPSGMTADQRRELEARQQQSKMRKAGGNSGDAGPLFNDDRDLFGDRVMLQRKPLAVRPLTPQARAHRNSAMGATPFIPDRRVWESLTRAGIPIWQRLRDMPGAASDAVDRARYTIQDRMLPFLRAQEAVMKQTGRRLPKEHDAYLAETTFSGKVGRHLLEIDEEYTKPIIQIIAKSKGKISADSVGEWLYARHAIERNAYIASINPNMPDGGSGMENIDAAQILADIANSPEAAQYNQIGAMIDALRERNLKLREDAGLISNADAQLWRTQYKHYVPLKGFEETDHYESIMDLRGVATGRRFTMRGAESRRALGRQSEAFNPLQSAITQAQEVAIRAEKNRVAQAMYELAANYPSKALWEVKKPKQKKYFNRTTGLVESRVENPVTMVLEPNEMAVKIGGQEHRILFNDQRLAESAGTLGADQMSGILRVLSMFSRFFSMTRTMLNPEFMITNGLRDFQTAQFNIQAFGENDKGRIAKAMAKNWRKAFLGAMRGSTYRFDTEWSKYYAEFQKAGAQVWFWTMEQPEAARGDLEQRIKLARGNKAQRALKVMTTPSAFFSFRDNAALNFIERTNLAVDNAIRLAAFVEARKAGWDVDKAAFLAKELTVNFNRRGEAGAQMNALYPFFNAAIQGTVRTVKAISSRRVAAMVLTAFAAGAMNDLLNAALSEEDEDGELFYDKVADFRNERNFHMVLWGTGNNPYAIPMPYGYNVFPYAGQQLGKVMRGVKKPEDAFADVAGAIFGAYSPISAKTPAQFISPVISDPVVEMAENKNWLGNPIYPRDYGNQSEPDSHVHFRSASEVSKYVAQTVNSMTGGDFRESGYVDVSPETLDHLAAFVVGSAGTFWGRSTDIAAKALQGDFDSIESRKIPFVRNLTSPIGDWADRDRFYRFSAEVKNAQADKRAYEAAGKPVPKKTADLATLYDAYLAANREMTGKGEWNPSKVGAVAAREQSKVYLDFNGKYLRVMGKQGE